MIDVGSNQFGGGMATPRMPRPQPIQAPMQAPPLQPSGPIAPPPVSGMKPGFGMSSNPAGRTMPQQAFGGAPRMTPQNPMYERFGRPNVAARRPLSGSSMGGNENLLPLLELIGASPELFQQLFGNMR